MSHRHAGLSALSALLVWTLDRGTKLAAVHHLPEGQSAALAAPWLHLTLHHNAGAAFGLGAHAPAALSVFATGLTLFLLFWWLRTAWAPRRTAQAYALALILGGSAGNLVDRYLAGAVIDFIDLGFWPIFNVADMAITAGAALWAGAVLCAKRGGDRCDR